MANLDCALLKDFEKPIPNVSFSGPMNLTDDEVGEDTARSTRRTMSLSMTVQIFVVVSLTILVISISLLFQYLAVAAVEDMGQNYIESAAFGAQSMLTGFINASRDTVHFLQRELERNEWKDFDELCEALFVVGGDVVQLFPQLVEAVFAVAPSGEQCGIDTQSFHWHTNGATENLFRSINLNVSTSKVQFHSSLYPNGSLDLLFAAVAHTTSFASVHSDNSVFLGITITPGTVRDVLDRFHTTSGFMGMRIALAFIGSTSILVSSIKYPVQTLSGTFFHLPREVLWFGSLETGSSIVWELQRDSYIAVIIAMAITVAACLAGVVLLRWFLTPLALICEDMKHAASMQLDGLHERDSVIQEVCDMNTRFGMLVSRLASYKSALAELGEFSACDWGETMKDQAIEATGDTAAAQHLVRVNLLYVSRTRQKQLAAVTFEHTYCNGDKNLLTDFAEECLSSVGERRFDQVALTVENRGRMVQIVSNRQLEEAFDLCPGELQVVMKKNAIRTLLSPFSLIVDFMNFGINIALIVVTLHSHPTDTEKLSAYIFTGLYSFCLLVNLFISLWLLRQGQENPKFKVWVGQARREVSLLLILCALNTQHIHFLWSNWSLCGILKFNAPRDVALWKLSVRWSLFGFFFSDLMQLFYKAYRLTGGDRFALMAWISVVASVISVAFGLPKKISFFTVGHGGREEDKVPDVESRARSGHTQNLVSKDVTVVMFKLPEVEKPPDRQALEASTFYSIVLAEVKRCEGSILYFHAADVLSIFNAPRAIPHHQVAATECVFKVIDALRAQNVKCCASIVTGDYPVGTMGSAKRKSFQCLAPTAMLHRVAFVGFASGIPCLATKKLAKMVELHFRAIPFSMLTDEGIVELRHRGDPKGKTATDVSDAVKALCCFSIREFLPSAMKHIGSFAQRWLENPRMMLDDPRDPIEWDDEVHASCGAAEEASASPPGTPTKAPKPAPEPDPVRSPNFIIRGILRPPRRHTQRADDVGQSDVELVELST